MVMSMYYKVSFSFLPKGDKMDLCGGEGKYVSVCKACGKLGGSRGMLPRENFIFYGIWDCFHTNIIYYLLCH